MTYGQGIRYVLITVCLAAGFFTRANDFIRGPYLQSLSHQSVAICWKSSVSDTVFTLKYGLHPDSLLNEKSVSSNDSNFQILIKELLPDTKYYYSIEYDDIVISQGPSFFFKTSKAIADTSGIRFWAMGDFGSGNALQRKVRDVFDSVYSNHPVDFWVWLGDNAYNSGLDSEYNRFVFDATLGYGKLLRSMPFFGIPGNHDYFSVKTTADPKIDVGPYYDIVVNPENGELGGYPSGTESYYSFDQGHVHFIALNSCKNALIYQAGSPMLSWLRNDLKANQLPWTIVLVHNPPYTKGSHDSDKLSDEKPSFGFRQFFLPLLDSFGVDLVLSGHSHGYERSYLINGHYGRSSEYNPANHLISGLSGNSAFDEQYVQLNGKGTVFSVVGNGGTFDDDNGILHPVMFMEYCGNQKGGSMIVDVAGSVLEAIYLNESGEELDRFSIQKVSDVPTSYKNFSDATSPIGIRKVYPNPGNDYLVLDVISEESGELIFSIYNTLGGLIRREIVFVSVGENRWIMNDLSDMPSSLYFIALQKDDIVFSTQWLKTE